MSNATITLLVTIFICIVGIIVLLETGKRQKRKEWINKAMNSFREQANKDERNLDILDKSVSVDELKRLAKDYYSQPYKVGDIVTQRNAKVHRYAFPMPGYPAIVLKVLDEDDIDRGNQRDGLYANESLVIGFKTSISDVLAAVSVDPVHFEYYKDDN